MRTVSGESVTVTAETPAPALIAGRRHTTGGGDHISNSSFNDYNVQRTLHCLHLNSIRLHLIRPVAVVAAMSAVASSSSGRVPQGEVIMEVGVVWCGVTGLRLRTCRVLN